MLRRFAYLIERNPNLAGAANKLSLKEQLLLRMLEDSDKFLPILLKHLVTAQPHFKSPSSKKSVMLEPSEKRLVLKLGEILNCKVKLADNMDYFKLESKVTKISDKFVIYFTDKYGLMTRDELKQFKILTPEDMLSNRDLNLRPLNDVEEQISLIKSALRGYSIILVKKGFAGTIEELAAELNAALSIAQQQMLQSEPLKPLENLKQVRAQLAAELQVGSTKRSSSRQLFVLKPPTTESKLEEEDGMIVDEEIKEAARGLLGFSASALGLVTKGSSN